MPEFQKNYSPEDIIALNLRETAERSDHVCEQEIAHIRELAKEISAEIDAHADLTESLPDRLPLPESSIAASALPENTQTLARLHQLHFRRQKALLCIEICKQLSQKRALTPDAFFADAEPLSPNARDRILYARSSYTDTAYLHFAPLLSEPRAAYTHSFGAACKDVYNGLCEFCILPVENSSEGVLNSFFRLMEQYELKIVATCDVTDPDARRTTRFALLRRNLTPLLQPQTPLQYFEYSIPQEAFSADLLLQTLTLCGMRLQSFAPLPVSEGKERTIHVTVDVKDGDLAPFLLLLTVEAPQYNPLGLYSHLSMTNKKHDI